MSCRRSKERKRFCFLPYKIETIHTIHQFIHILTIHQNKKIKKYKNTNLTIPIFEDDLIVLEEKFRHDVRIFPVQPEWSLGRGHDSAFFKSTMQTEKQS